MLTFKSILSLLSGSDRATHGEGLIDCITPAQVCTAMGCSAGFATAPLSGRVMRKCAIPHSLSLAWHLGRAVLAARHAKADPVAAAAREGHGTMLFEGMPHPRTTVACLAQLLLA